MKLKLCSVAVFFLSSGARAGPIFPVNKYVLDQKHVIEQVRVTITEPSHAEYLNRNYLSQLVEASVVEGVTNAFVADVLDIAEIRSAGLTRAPSFIARIQIRHHDLALTKPSTRIISEHREVQARLEMLSLQAVETVVVGLVFRMQVNDLGVPDRIELAKIGDVRTLGTSKRAKVDSLSVLLSECAKRLTAPDKK